MESRTFRIGEIASRTGVSVETLRYYEKRRLLPSPSRTQGGFRRYPNGTIQQVRFIKIAQSLGLTLDNVRHLVVTRESRDRSPACHDVRQLLTRRLEDIDARIRALRSFRRTLNEHLIACEQALVATTDPSCPTIDALERPEAR